MQRLIIHVAAAVIVDDDGRTLVVRKRGTTAFMQPGGKIDPCETALEALHRELLEELAVTVSPSDVRALGQHIAEAANEPGHVVKAELFSVTLRDQPRPAAEIEEIAWIDPTNPAGLELAPLTAHTVLGLLQQP
jgi:8-oxo-dGTP diphosphatase